METVYVNTNHLSKIKEAFPGLDQDKGEITIPFTVDDFNEINYMKSSLLEVIENICYETNEDKSFKDIQNVGNLIKICKKLEGFNMYDFLNDLILPYNKENTKPINQK